MERRNLFLGALALILTWNARGQTVAVALRLVRRSGWEQLMARNQCVISELYRTTPDFPLSDIGTKISNALELAYRGNQNDISSIPPGEYSGAVRTDGPKGWRIELTGTAARKHIQIHVGNTPDDTVGCILPGTGESTDKACKVAGSRTAMEKLKSVVGLGAAPKVVLKVQE